MKLYSDTEYLDFHAYIAFPHFALLCASVPLREREKMIHIEPNVQ